MDFEPAHSNEEASDYSLYSDTDSESNIFYYGYSEKPVRRVLNDYVSLPRLKAEYNGVLDMEKKILLFFNAVQDQDFRFMERLLTDEVKVDCIGKDGWTPLMKACLSGQVRVVQFLLHSGANPHFRADYYTPLMACCTYNTSSEGGKLGCVNLLLEHNADVNLKDKYKTTALMHASGSGYLTIVDRLFMVEDLIADAQDFDGWNAIFHAVSNNRVVIVKALIDYGVDYTVQDNYGRTPLILAEERCLPKVVELFMDLEDSEGSYSRKEEYKENEWEKNPYGYYLTQLPDANGEGGFRSDTGEILALHGFDQLQNVSFPDFLTMGDEDLLAAGVKIKSKRRFILLKVIHRFHRCPWHKSSLNSIMRGTSLELDEMISILGNIAKHLTLIKASLRYFKGRIEDRIKRPDVTLQKDTIEVLIWIFVLNRNIQTRLNNILQLGNKVEASNLEDLIVPKSEKKSSKVRTTFKYGLMILGATAAGYLLLHSKLKIGCFIKKFMFVRK